MIPIETIREAFAADQFAARLGIQIDSVDGDSAVCSLAIRPEHRNAMGAVQGGVVFTLADFAFAVATNWEKLSTVTLNSAIHYLKPAGGERLTATAACVSRSRTVCVYEIRVMDDQGVQVAWVTSTGYTKA